MEQKHEQLVYEKQVSCFFAKRGCGVWDMNVKRQRKIEIIIDIAQQLPYNRSKKNDKGGNDVFLGSAQDNYKLL